MRIAFFGSSLVSAYWNGAATYYRGIMRALAARGHRITFYEPDAYERQQHRDMRDPHWARSWFTRRRRKGSNRALEQAAGADLIVKASGVGVFDELLEAAVASLKHSIQPGRLLGCGCAGHARPRPAQSGRPVRHFDSRATTWSSPMAAAIRWCARIPRWARAPAFPSTTRSIRTRIFRSPPTRALRATWLSRQSVAGPRGARGGVLSAGRRPLSPGCSSCWAAPAGATSQGRPTSATSATSTRAITTRSTARRRGAERLAREHGALRLFARHAGVRGRRRRRLPDHRCMGGHRSVSSAGR